MLLFERLAGTSLLSCDRRKVVPGVLPEYVYILQRELHRFLDSNPGLQILAFKKTPSVQTSESKTKKIATAESVFLYRDLFPDPLPGLQTKRQIPLIRYGKHFYLRMYTFVNKKIWKVPHP